MMKICLKLSLVMLFMSFSLTPSFADTIHLKSGDSFDGEIISESDRGVVFEIDGGTIEFRHDEIEKLERTGKPKKKKAVESGSVLPERSTEEGFLGGVKKQWENLMSMFSKDKQKKKVTSKSKEGWMNSIWVFLGLQSLIAFFVVGLTMKLYFAIFGESLSYWLMLWFQIKTFLIGLLVACVIGACFGGARAIFAGAGSQPSPWGAVISMIAYVIVFYRVAKKDLDSGIFKTFGLSWVMALTNLAIWKVMVVVGFDFTIPREWMNYLN